jgi:RNA-binding protein YlmH
MKKNERKMSALNRTAYNAARQVIKLVDEIGEKAKNEKDSVGYDINVVIDNMGLDGVLNAMIDICSTRANNLTNDGNVDLAKKWAKNAFVLREALRKLAVVHW